MLKKKNLLAVLALLLAFSCSEEMAPVKQTVIDGITTENGRLVFPSHDSFLATTSRLNKVDGETLAQWRSQFPIESLYDRVMSLNTNDDQTILSKQDEEFSIFPISHLHVLNSDGEVKIGDKIMRYENGKIYSASSEAEMAVIRSNPAEAKTTSSYQLGVTDVNLGNSNTAGRTVTGWPHGAGAAGSGLYSDHASASFKSTTDGKYRKYVDRLVSYKEQWYALDAYRVYLYLVLKVDYKDPSGTWVTSNAPRYSTWDFNYYIESFGGNGTMDNGPVYGRLTGSSGIIENIHKLFLMESGHANHPIYNGYHNVQITGRIDHWLSRKDPACEKCYHPWTNVE